MYSLLEQIYLSLVQAYYSLVQVYSLLVYTYLPTPTLGQDITKGQFFKRSLAGLKSELSFSRTSCWRT